MEKTELNVLWHSTGFPSGLLMFFFGQFCVSSCACDWWIKTKLWDSLSELRSSVCERRLERTVLRPAQLLVKTAQSTQFFRQV
jgi:hypothetical protein